MGDSAASSPETREAVPLLWTVEGVQQAFDGRFCRLWTSPAYLAALGVVAPPMAILPLVYVLMIGATGYGVYLWAEHGRFLFHGPTGGIYGMVIRGTLYAAPLAAGLVTVVFMVKPLLARPGRRAQPLALNPAAEPVLYALVREVARQMLALTQSYRFGLSAERLGKFPARTPRRFGWRSGSDHRTTAGGWLDGRGTGRGHRPRTWALQAGPGYATDGCCQGHQRLVHPGHLRTG